MFKSAFMILFAFIFTKIFSELVYRICSKISSIICFAKVSVSQLIFTNFRFFEGINSRPFNNGIYVKFCSISNVSIYNKESHLVPFTT